MAKSKKSNNYSGLVHVKSYTRGRPGTAKTPTQKKVEMAFDKVSDIKVAGAMASAINYKIHATGKTSQGVANANAIIRAGTSSLKKRK